MAGYWDLAAQYPSIVSNAAQSIAGAIAANRQRSQQARLLEFQKQQEANRAAQETRQLDIQEAGRVLEQQKIDAEGERNKQKAAAEQKFNYLAASYAKTQYPELRDAAKKQMYAVDPQKAQEFFKNEASISRDPNAAKPDDIAAQVEFGYGLKPGSAEFQSKYQELMTRDRQDKLNRAKAVGGVSTELTGAQTSRVQGEILNADAMISQLDRISSAIEGAGGADSLSSWVGRGAAAVSDAALKTPLASAVRAGQREKLRARALAESSIATFRNNIFNKLSGAAISDSELARLMQSVPDVGDTGPTLEAKMSTWRSNLEYERKHGMDALIKGLSAGGAASITPDQARAELARRRSRGAK